MEPRFIKQRQKENKQKTNQPTTKNVTLPHNIPKCEIILIPTSSGSYSTGTNNYYILIP